MECKVSSAICSRYGSKDLIDTLWNVKPFALAFFISPEPDLIDTLWNVKENSTVHILAAKKDLIDTLWNVK